MAIKAVKSSTTGARSTPSRTSSASSSEIPAISVGSFDHAALKKFPCQLTADRREPSGVHKYCTSGRSGRRRRVEDDSPARCIISSGSQGSSIRGWCSFDGQPCSRFDHWQPCRPGRGALDLPRAPREWNWKMYLKNEDRGVEIHRIKMCGGADAARSGSGKVSEAGDAN